MSSGSKYADSNVRVLDGAGAGRVAMRSLDARSAEHFKVLA